MSHPDPKSAMWQEAQHRTSVLWADVTALGIYARPHSVRGPLPYISASATISRAPPESIWVTLFAFAESGEMSWLRRRYDAAAESHPMSYDAVLRKTAEIAERSGPQAEHDIHKMQSWAQALAESAVSASNTAKSVAALTEGDWCGSDSPDQPEPSCCVTHRAVHAVDKAQQDLRSAFSEQSRHGFAIVPYMAWDNCEILVAQFPATQARYPLCPAKMGPAGPEVYDTLTDIDCLNSLMEGFSRWRKAAA